MQEVQKKAEAKRAGRIEKTGKVLSGMMDKSRVILIESKAKHTFYKKFVCSRKKVMAHDESNISNAGDTVRIVQCRPLSKCKRWRVEEVIEKGETEQNGTVDVGIDGGR
ncbi:MAG: 30S ribosomal protein S17 [Candidatus Omnitrophica bacterium]|nr:30S ribosomal protein S17 [Candidatus Omnitrophota bacterium]